MGDISDRELIHQQDIEIERLKKALKVIETKLAYAIKQHGINETNVMESLTIAKQALKEKEVREYDNKGNPKEGG